MSRNRELSTQELQEYYESVLETLNSVGWSRILEDIQGKLTTCQVGGWRSSDDSLPRMAGYITHMEEMVQLKETYEASWEQIQEQETVRAGGIEDE